MIIITLFSTRFFFRTPPTHLFLAYRIYERVQRFCSSTGVFDKEKYRQIQVKQLPNKTWSNVGRVGAMFNGWSTYPSLTEPTPPRNMGLIAGLFWETNGFS